MKMPTTLDRVKIWVKSSELSVSSIETTIGVSNGTLAYVLKSGKTINSELIEKLITTYPINPVWLLTGNGPMETGTGNGMDVNEEAAAYTKPDPVAELLQTQRDLINSLKKENESLALQITRQKKTNHNIGVILSQFERDIAKLKNPAEASFENLAFKKILREADLLT